MDIKAFIFDVDGVLTDTVELHYRSWQRLAQEEGIHIDRQMNDRMRGLSRPASLAVFLGDRSITDEQAQDFLRRKNEYFLESMAELSEQDLLPGVLPLLEEIRAAGLKIGIGSASKNAREVVCRLGIDSFIDAYADGCVTQVSKPAPDVFLAAAALLQVPPEGCIVVEDAEAGIEAAHTACMQVIGVGPRSRVAAADLPAESLADLRLADVLGALGGTRTS